MKIAFSASVYALGHCLQSSWMLVPLHMCKMSYGPWNTAHFGIAAYCNYCHVSKNRQKDQDKEQFVCLEGYLSIVCVLVEQRVKAKGPWEFEELESPMLAIPQAAQFRTHHSSALLGIFETHCYTIIFINTYHQRQIQEEVQVLMMSLIPSLMPSPMSQKYHVWRAWREM